jgi:Domain of unknown function (DUF4402)
MNPINRPNQRFLKFRWNKPSIFFLKLFLLSMFSLPTICSAQQEAVKTTAYTLQHLSFGAFFQFGSGGKVTVSCDGNRTSEGGIILSNQAGTFYPAIFEIAGPINSTINILNGGDITLSGYRGGTILLHLEASNPASPFVLLKPLAARKDIGVEYVNLGGTLTIGSSQSSPPGDYNGAFTVTFIQE